MKDWLKHNWFKVSFIILAILAGTISLVGYNRYLSTISDNSSNEKTNYNPSLINCMNEAQANYQTDKNSYEEMIDASEIVTLPFLQELDTRLKNDQTACIAEFSDNNSK